MNLLAHRAQLKSVKFKSLIVSLGGSWRWIFCQTEHRDNEWFQHDSSYVSYVGPGDEKLATQSTLIWILPRTTLHVSLQVVAEFYSNATHSTMWCYLPNITFHVSCLLIPGSWAGKHWYRFSPVWIYNVSLWSVPRDKFLTTQRTVIWILCRMTVHVSCYVVPRGKTLSTQSTVIYIFPSMTLCVVE